MRIRRPVLRATVVRLKGVWPEMASILERQLQGSGVAKPRRHDGGAETDEFQVELSHQEIERIVDAMGELEASLGETDAPAFQVSATADLLDFWNRHLIDIHDRS